MSHLLLVAPICGLTGLLLSDILPKGKENSSAPFRTPRWHDGSSFSEFHLSLPSEVRDLLGLDSSTTVGYILAASNIKEVLSGIAELNVPKGVQVLLFCENTHGVNENMSLMVQLREKQVIYHHQRNSVIVEVNSAQIPTESLC